MQLKQPPQNGITRITEDDLALIEGGILPRPPLISLLA